MPTVTDLPLELLDEAFSQLDKQALCSLVLVNHHLRNVALPHLYAQIEIPLADPLHPEPSKSIVSESAPSIIPLIKTYSHLVQRLFVPGEGVVYSWDGKEEKKAERWKSFAQAILALTDKPNVRAVVWTSYAWSEKIAAMIASLPHLRYLGLGMQLSVQHAPLVPSTFQTKELKGLKFSIDTEVEDLVDHGGTDEVILAQIAELKRKKNKALELGRDLIKHSESTLEGLDISVMNRPCVKSRARPPPGRGRNARWLYWSGSRRYKKTIGEVTQILKGLRLQRLTRLGLAVDFARGEEILQAADMQDMGEIIQAVPWSQLTVLELDQGCGSQEIFDGLAIRGIVLAGLKRFLFSGTQEQLEGILNGMLSLEEAILTHIHKGFGTDDVHICDGLARALANLRKLRVLEVYSVRSFSGEQMLSMTQNWPDLEKLVITVKGEDWGKIVGALCAPPNLRSVAVALDPISTPLDQERANTTLLQLANTETVPIAGVNNAYTGILPPEEALEARARAFLLDLVENIFQSAVVRVPLDRELSPTRDVKLQDVGLVLDSSSSAYRRGLSTFKKYKVVAKKRRPRWTALRYDSEVITFMSGLEAIMGVVAGWEVGLVGCSAEEEECITTDEAVLFGSEYAM